MKLEAPMYAWLNDVDGKEIAESFNAYLPQSIRISGVVPVTKSFNAKMSCYSRSYDYFLPAGCLVIEVSSAEEVAFDPFKRQESIPQLHCAQHLQTFTEELGYKQAAREVKEKTEFEHTEKQVMSVSERDESDSGDEEFVGEEDIEEQDSGLLETQIPRRRAYLVDPSNLVDVVKASHYSRVTECTCGGLEKLGSHTSQHRRVVVI